MFQYAEQLFSSRLERGDGASHPDAVVVKWVSNKWKLFPSDGCSVTCEMWFLIDRFPEAAVAISWAEPAPLSKDLLKKLRRTSCLVLAENPSC